ncbi:unnamed protein product [Caretta caretta]
MAAADPTKNVKDHVTCSICLDLFRDPVTAECGHSFCTDCIAQHCEEKENNCPQCRKRFQKSNLRPNRELKNIVDSILQLSSLTVEKPVRGNMCERHQEPLKLYCKEDQIPLCLVCDRSRRHRHHTVVPMEEAIQEYREKIAEQLGAIEFSSGKLQQLVREVWKYLSPREQEEEHERLKKVTDNLVTLLTVDIKGQRQRSEDAPSQTQTQTPFNLKNFCPGRKIAEETELQEHKERENIRERVAEKQETAGRVIRICEEAPTPKYGLDHTSLDPVIHSISNTTEDIHHKADIKGLRQRAEDLTSPKQTPESGLKRGEHFSTGEKLSVEESSEGNTMRVTLDQDTAHPALTLSADRLNVRHGDKQQDLPDNPERFNERPCVLGSQGFTKGAVYWEVEVGSEVFWVVGVARESVRRKGWVSASQKEGIWAIDWSRWMPPVPPSPQSTPPQKSRRIRVCLHYEGRQVTFFNADNEALILTVTGANFARERIRPFFGTKSQLRLCPCPEPEGQAGDPHQ